MDRKTPVESLRKGLAILDILAGPDAPLPLAHIAKRMGLKRSTTYNLLKTLSLCGYATNDGEGRYRSGPEARELARKLLTTGPVSPLLLRLVGETSATLDEAVVLTAFLSGRRRVLARARGSQVIQVAWDALEERGRRHWETVTGRVMAAFCKAEELCRLLEREGFPGACWEGISSSEALMSALCAIRAAGYAEAHECGVASYAVPILSESGVLLGALGSHLPEFRSQAARAACLIDVLRNAAEQLGRVWIIDQSDEERQERNDPWTHC